MRPPSNPGPSVQFVVSTGTEKADPELRKFIRSHVMQGKNKGKKLPPRVRKPKPGQAVPPPPTSAAAAAAAAARPTSKSHPSIPVPSHVLVSSRNHRSEVCDIPAPIKTAIQRNVLSAASCVRLADSTLEPFMVEVVFNFSTIAKSILFPLESCLFFVHKPEQWVGPLGSDPAFLHAMIFTAQCFFDSQTAGINENSRGRGFMTHSRKALPHCIKAIELLRERFATGDDESRKSMTTVGTITSLAVLAHASGDHLSASNHLDGLRGIVKMREGGLKSFDENVKLMVEVLRTDLGVALFHGDGTRFFDADGERYAEFPDMTGLVPKLFLKGKGQVARRVPKGVDGCSELGRIWTVLREFTGLVNYAAGTGKLIPMELYADCMTSTMYRLIGMGRLGTVEAQGSSEGNKLEKEELEVFRVGLLAYACSIFLQWKGMMRGRNHPYPFLAGQFRQAFDKMRNGGLEPKMVLWLIMVGATALLDVPGEDERWVGDALRENMRLCGITEWAGLRGVLEEVMWVGLVHDALGRKVMEVVASSVMNRVA